MPTNQISTFLGRSRPPHLARDYLQAYLRYAENIHAGEFESASALLRSFAIEPPASEASREASVAGLPRPRVKPIRPIRRLS
jgi:hypothetical protein